MTCRRLLLLPAALPDAAFSVAFWLRGWIAVACAAAAAEPGRSTRSHSLPTVRPFDLRCTADQLGRPARAEHPPISPDVHGTSLYSLPPLAAGAGRSNSSRFQQIPLLVGSPKPLFSALQNGAFRTHLQRLGRRSLNPTLSLHGGVA
jgi:hypothetical protein